MATVTSRPITTTDTWVDLTALVFAAPAGAIIVGEEYLLQGYTVDKALISISPAAPLNDLESFVISNVDSLSSIVDPLSTKIWAKSQIAGKSSTFKIKTW